MASLSETDSESVVVAVRSIAENAIALKKKRPSVEGRFLKARARSLVRRASGVGSVAGIVRVITRGARRFGHDVDSDHGAAVDLLASAFPPSRA